jgi:hypothetical protein
MKRYILLALLLVAFVVTPAFAAVDSVRVRGSLSSTFIQRDNFNLGVANSPTSQNLLITQAVLGVDAKLTENVDVTIQLLSERPWGEDDDTLDDTQVDVNLAFIQMREMLDPHITAIVGRQDFRFGNSFAFDTAGTNNSVTAGALASIAADLSLRTAQDSVRFIFDYAPLTVTAFASKIDGNTLAGAGAQDDDVDVYGVVANYAVGDSFDSVVEPYFFHRNDQSTKSAVGSKADVIYMPGLRVATNPISGLHVEGEFAFQGGNRAVTAASPDENQKRQAWGAQFITSYAIPLEAVKQWEPVTTLVFTHVTGDSNPAEFATTTSEKFTGWDPFYENQSTGKIYNALFNLTNVNIIEHSLQVKPIEDVTAKVSGSYMWLDQNINTTDGAETCSGSTCLILIQPDGVSTITPTVAGGTRYIGWELDSEVTWDYTEDVQIGLNMGWLFLGDLFFRDNRQQPKQFLANVDVAF